MYQVYVVYTDTMDQKRASTIRQQIRRLQKKRESIEQELLHRRLMLRASFLTRHLGTSKSKRKSPAYYLSFRKLKKTVLRYVPAKGRQKVEAQANAWGDYQRLVAQWGKTSKDLESLWRSLGDAQADDPDSQDASDEQ